jgi:hypothetical protein
MPTLDIFNDDAFSMVSLTAAVRDIPFAPSKLGDMGIFTEKPINTTTAMVESEGGVLSLVDASPRGAPGTPMDHATREARGFKVPHIQPEDYISADEIIGLRAFGEESELETVARYVAGRMAPMVNSVSYTREAHRVAAVQGHYFKATGGIGNLFQEFNVSQQEVAFALSSDTTKLRAKCLEVLEKVEEALGGLPFSGLLALCGKNFWPDFIEAKAVKDSYLNTPQAAELRGSTIKNIDFGDILWSRYRGTNQVKIEDDEAVIIPIGVPELFITSLSPADYWETAGTMGQPIYAKQYDPNNSGKGVKLEVQSNPLSICTRPRACIRIKRGT